MLQDRDARGAAAAVDLGDFDRAALDQEDAVPGIALAEDGFALLKRTVAADSRDLLDLGVGEAAEGIDLPEELLHLHGRGIVCAGRGAGDASFFVLRASCFVLPRRAVEFLR